MEKIFCYRVVYCSCAGDRVFTVIDYFVDINTGIATLALIFGGVRATLNPEHMAVNTAFAILLNAYSIAKMLRARSENEQAQACICSLIGSSLGLVSVLGSLSQQNLFLVFFA